MTENNKKFMLFPKQYGLFPYVYLIYLLLPAYYVITSTGWYFIFGFVLLLLFFISYRQLYKNLEIRVTPLWFIIQKGVILLFSIIFSFNNMFLSFFTSYFLGWEKRKNVFIPLYILYSLVICIPLVIHYETIVNTGPYYYLPFIIIMLIVPFGIQSMNSRMELEEKLKSANDQIEELIKREERVRIARDLHDTLGHTLSLISLKAQLVSKLVYKDVEKARLEAIEIEKTSRSTLTQVRELVYDMKSSSISDVLLEVDSILVAAGVTYHYEGVEEIRHIPAIPQNILSMCLREAVTNIVKHSQAKHCFIKLESDHKRVKLTIEDNGTGINIQYNDGNGLRGMQERLTVK